MSYVFISSLLPEVKEDMQPQLNAIKIGGIYHHYKNKQYRVIGIAHHSETMELLVVYQALYDTPDFGNNALWVRPLNMFLETITVDGKQIPRFRLID